MEQAPVDLPNHAAPIQDPQDLFSHGTHVEVKFMTFSHKPSASNS